MRTMPLKIPFGVQDFFVLIAILSLVLVQYEGLADDPGVGWHLATGEWILSHRTVPGTDPFLAPRHSRPWVADQWAADLLLAVQHRAAGWSGVYALLTGLFLFGFLGPLYFVVSRLAGTALGASFATVAAFKLAQVHFLVRPVVFGILVFLCVFLVCAVLDARRRVSGAHATWVQICLLAGIFALWANLHGSFLLGLVVVALYAGCGAISAVNESDWSALLRYLALPLLAFAAGIANPYGLGIYEHALELGGSTYFMQYHEEWQSPDFMQYEGALFLVTLAIPVVALAVARRVPRTWSLFETMALLVFAVGSFRAVRVLPYFGIVAAPVVARSMMVPALRLRNRPWARLLVRLFAKLDRREFRTSRGLPLLVLALLGLSLCTVGFFDRVPLSNVRYGPSEERYPYRLLELLLERTPVTESAVVVAPPFWGGFLTWGGQGRLLAVIDDRNSLLGEESYRRYYEELHPQGDWREYLSGLNATYLLLPPQHALAQRLRHSRELEFIAETPIAVAFQVNHERYGTQNEIENPE